MSLIKKPNQAKYINLSKKTRLTEETYLRMLEYIEWNPSLDGDKDTDFLIEESLKFVFESDKEFKKYQKSKNAKSKPVNVEEVQEELQV